MEEMRQGSGGALGKAALEVEAQGPSSGKGRKEQIKQREKRGVGEDGKEVGVRMRGKWGA